jgi:hypothetical protein
MVKWRFWQNRVTEAGRGDIYKNKVQEETKGLQVTSYQYNQEEIRLPHPNNMGKYEEWLLDGEANVAVEVLSKIIAGVGYYTEMPEEFKPEKEGDPDHKNKLLVDNYGEAINLDEDLQCICSMMLSKGIAPVEIIDSNDGNYDLNILPAESFYKYINKKGETLKYTQERSHGDVIAEWKTKEEIASIVPFIRGWTPTRPYGTSLLEPIGGLLEERDKMNKDMPKAIHRWAYPQVIFRSSGTKAAIQKEATEKDPEEALFLGNMKEDELTVTTIGIDPQARFVPYIEMIYYQIAEGLHAPLLLYLKNATEASATVMMESVDRLVNGMQRYIKRRVERYLFEPQTGDPVPKLVWGQPKTGLEDVTLTDIASIINSPSVANNQVQWILKQYWSSIPEPDWSEEAKIQKQKNPMPLQAPGQQPFQKKPKGQEIPVEKVLERLNDLNTNLRIIEENFKAGKLKVHEAARFAERVIKVHMTKYQPDDIENKTSERWQQFMKKIIPSGDKSKKEYTVIVPD